MFDCLVLILKSLKLIKFCRRAKDLVTTHIDVLHKTAARLLEKESIDGDEFLRIVTECEAVQYLKDDAPAVTVPYRN